MIRLNLDITGSEIRKPSLKVNTICIRVNLGNVQGTFVVVFTAGDDNRQQNYKITKFTVFVKSDVGGGGGKVLNLILECSRRERGLPKLGKSK